MDFSRLNSTREFFKGGLVSSSQAARDVNFTGPKAGERGICKVTTLQMRGYLIALFFAFFPSNHDLLDLVVGAFELGWVLSCVTKAEACALFPLTKAGNPENQKRKWKEEKETPKLFFGVSFGDTGWL